MTAASPAPVRSCWVDLWEGVGGTRRLVRRASRYYRRVAGVWTCIHCGAER